MGQQEITVDIGKVCIIIASHISSSRRIEYLKECLESLATQTFPISIYLSISFETTEIYQEFQNINFTPFPHFFLHVRPEKTPQMKHVQLVLPELLKNNEKWVLFSDDDDRHDPTRTQKFAQLFADGMYAIEKHHPNYIFAGVYESTFGKNHREHRHEFWCYGIHIDVLKMFHDRIQPYDDVIRHKCCDIVFGNYLRRLSEKYIFIQLEEPLYDYRVENNEDSITGKIRNNALRKFVDSPPTITDPHFSDYIVKWNIFLHENADYYIHDTFLRTVIGDDFDEILRSEFKKHYPLLEHVDKCHVENIREHHEYLRGVCAIVYDIW